MRIYSSLLLQGKFCSAVRWIVDRERGGVYQTSETCSKNGETIMEMLWSKLQEAHPSSDASLKRYMGMLLSMVPLDIMEGVMTEVGHRISIGERLGVTDAVSLQQWILQYREASSELRKIVASITEWLENYCFPWTAYWALMTVHLIGQDNHPIIRIVGIIETWFCCFAKYVLAVAGPEAKEACGIEHLCVGL